MTTNYNLRVNLDNMPVRCFDEVLEACREYAFVERVSSTSGVPIHLDLTFEVGDPLHIEDLWELRDVIEELENKLEACGAELPVKKPTPALR